MTYSILLFITRRPGSTPEQFKDHYENVHLPLAEKLCGTANWPISFTRRYIARIARKGFGGPANPDNPPLLLRGDAQHIDYDCIADMTFESEENFRAFYRKIYEQDVAKVLAADETSFLEVGKTRVVVVGETIATEHGTTTTMMHPVSTADPSDSDASTSDHSDHHQATKEE